MASPSPPPAPLPAPHPCPLWLVCVGGFPMSWFLRRRRHLLLLELAGRGQSGAESMKGGTVSVLGGGVFRGPCRCTEHQGATRPGRGLCLCARYHRAGAPTRHSQGLHRSGRPLGASQQLEEFVRLGSLPSAKSWQSRSPRPWGSPFSREHWPSDLRGKDSQASCTNPPLPPPVHSVRAFRRRLEVTNP